MKEMRTKERNASGLHSNPIATRCFSRARRASGAPEKQSVS